ncbi:Na+/H+ antiporter NhaC family protein [Arthrobacter roseus]|uniref:Na+/H+ antiporter NhaC family protein n=1 Tax=Arthrobacter roseus TaxID=136274 RepID=UPI0019658877|nr:Na+/H+ antiporter NhaC family protein [Arthrobacter roseus]MBM7847870.1 Na+/H+ antiporter NhaC [Arthrobacter roseus]
MGEVDTKLEFFGGRAAVLIAPIIFIAIATYNLAFLHVYEMTALVAGGLVGLIINAFFARSYGTYWKAVMRGVGSPGAASLILILLVVSLISSLLSVTGVSGGFIWLANLVGIGGVWFVPITFVLAGLMAVSTGTSLGTLFAIFPIFYPAGVALGASPVLMAGAILSGALFGDNMAPISDSTIVSAMTQRYRNKEGSAQVGDIVRTRFRYASAAAVIAFLLFAGFSLASGGASGAVDAAAAEGSPRSLFMLIAIAVLIVVAIWKRDIFLAVSVGLVVGVITGLLSGALTWSQIISAGEANSAGGFMASGILGMLPLIGISIVVFAIIGTFQESGLFVVIIRWLQGHGLTGSPMKAELSIFTGSIVTTGLFASVNGPAMLLFGPVVDEVGAAAKLHPNRRSNVMDCGALGLGSVMPVISTFLLISSQLTQGSGETLSALAVFGVAFYPLALTVVMLIAIVTGWGRTFEGPKGEELRGRTAQAAGVTDLP